MRIAFLGTPEFAVPSLEEIIASQNHEVALVITQPDRKSGRGMKLQAPPIKVCAEKNNIPVFQTTKINDEATIQLLTEHKVEQIVVVAFGEFLGKSLLDFCEYAPVNVHPSLLPKLRGAAPLQWSVIRGFAESGVSIQFMVSKMDAGDIILQKKEEVFPNETAGELHDRYKLIGATLLVEALDQIADKSFRLQTQDESQVSLAPLLKKTDGEINWERPRQEIHNLIRGCAPWPGATTKLAGKKVKIHKSIIPAQNECPPSSLKTGEFQLYGEHYFVGTLDGMLQIEKLQLEGKRAMLPKEFANGMRELGEQRFSS